MEIGDWRLPFNAFTTHSVTFDAKVAIGNGAIWKMPFQVLLDKKVNKLLILSAPNVCNGAPFSENINARDIFMHWACEY